MPHITLIKDDGKRGKSIEVVDFDVNTGRYRTEYKDADGRVFMIGTPTGSIPKLVSHTGRFEVGRPAKSKDEKAES